MKNLEDILDAIMKQEPSERERIFRLLKKHFDNFTKELVESDLSSGDSKNKEDNAAPEESAPGEDNAESAPGEDDAATGDLETKDEEAPGDLETKGEESAPVDLKLKTKAEPPEASEDPNAQDKVKPSSDHESKKALRTRHLTREQLRRQRMLQELLAPPLSLRDDDEL